MGEPDARSDESLMLAAAEGDLVAFDALLRRYERRILSYSYRLLGDYETSRDILQQTFLNIFERRAEYRAEAKFSTFLYCVAHNLCHNELRRLRRRHTTSLEAPRAGAADEDFDWRPWLVDEAGEPLEPLSQEEEERLLREAVEQLDPMYREVIALRMFENLPFKDIADITSTSESTVKSRLRYALAYLAKALRRKLQRD